MYSLFAGSHEIVGEVCFEELAIFVEFCCRCDGLAGIDTASAILKVDVGRLTQMRQSWFVGILRSVWLECVNV